MFHHKLKIVIKINKINCINHLNQYIIMFLKGLIMFIKDLPLGYSKIDFKDHVLFKVKENNILIHKFIDPKVNQVNNDINLLIINSNVFIVELIVSLNLNVQLEMLFVIYAIKLIFFQGFVNRQEGSLPK